MTETLHSPHWHEVASLRPALRNLVNARRLRSRGRVWHLLTAPASREQLRLNAPAWRFVALLDGQQTLDNLWHQLHEAEPEAAPSQPEVLDLLARLNAAGFLKTDMPLDFVAQFSEARRRERSHRFAAMSPLAMRVRLFNPGPLIDAIAPWFTAIFTPLALILWVALVGMSALRAASEWPALAGAVAQAGTSPRFVLIAWLLYPLMKAVHELAHGLTIRHFGGTVPTAGFTLLVLVPVPWVDASAANAFPRAQRVLVSAAGVITELLVAALAFWLWLSVAPGVVRDVALTAFVIGALSSLLINGNPLLRFDGYYAFTDLLDLPNLGTRSRRWWQALIGRSLLRTRATPMDTAPGETKWLTFYAPASWLFQIFIGWHIVGWISGLSTALGTVAAVSLIVALFIMPAWRSIQHWLAPDAGRSHSPARRRLTIAGAAFAAFALLVPLPSATTVPGVLTLPDAAFVRADTDGFIAEWLARDGEHVVAGQPVARLEDPALRAQANDLNSQLSALHSRQYASLLRDPREAGDLRAQIANVTSELAEVRDRVTGLTLLAGSEGTLALPHAADLLGTFLARGHTLGHVLKPEMLKVRAVVPNSDAARVRDSTKAISVRLADAQQRPLAAEIRHFAAGASHSLPAPGLSERFGGPIAVRAEAADGDQAAEPFFDVELALAHPPVGRIDERVWVRFAHADAPLAIQWSRSARQLLLKFFEGAA